MCGLKSRRIENEWFIRQIAEGDPALDGATITRLSQQLGFPRSQKRWFCIAARLAAPEGMTADAQLPITLYSACQAAQKLYPGAFYCYIGTNLCVVMVVTEDTDRTVVANTLHQHISKRCGLPLQFGVGRSYPQIDKLSYSRVEAYEALGELSENGQISYIEDIYASRSITTRKLDSQRRRIIELFKTGQLDRMDESMAQLVENVRSESPVRKDAPYPTSIRRTILEVLFEIMHISADAGVDVDALMDYQDPYARAFQISGTTTPILLEWLSGIAHKLHGAISERHSRTQSNMLQLAKACIDQHLSNPELSLSLVSQTLEITPTYLSAFFIREMGLGFNEYVTALRTEKAKQLLTKTNKKINQIAAECGFRSASYFIVVFRKQVGMAPGEYRDMKK